MKNKLFLFMMLGCGIAFAPTAKAQVADTMSVPMGCFEQWSTYPADTLMLLGMPLPVNEEYILPDGWSVPNYVVEETISFSGASIPLNLSLPVGKVWKDTVNAPEGFAGVVAESFMFSDLLTPTAYMLASAALDSTLTNMVLPTILSNGQVNLDKILEFVDFFTTGNTEDQSWLLDILDTADFNNYISGGFPVGIFQPGRVIGYYKYRYDHSVGPRDNGLLVAIGTKYDFDNHRRMLVGAGSKTLFELYDTTNYTPFELEYFPIGDYLPDGYPFIPADTMVLLAVSSAGTKGFIRGSKLFLDSLQLVQLPGPCGRIQDLRIGYHNSTMIELIWNNSATPDHWEVQYGRSGFYLGHGTIDRVDDSSHLVRNLEPNTSYDFYVRGLCGDSAYTPWVFITATTDERIPQSVLEVQDASISLYPNPANGRCVVDCGGVEVECLRLYTVDGRMIKEQTVKNDKFELSLPNAGLYIVELQTRQGLVHKRLVNK